MKEGSLNVLFINRGDAFFLSDNSPDEFSYRPTADHVLCRDSNGNPTAVYGEDYWDFNPYRLSSKKIRVLSFGDFVKCDDEVFRSKLSEEAKFILYLLMHFSASGYLGRLSASTLVQYFFQLRSMAKFCVSSLDNDLAQGISLFDLLSNSAYLRSYLGRKDVAENQRKQTSALLTALNQIDIDVLGFESCPKKLFNFERREDRQHPVIPPRIYIAIMNHYESLIEDVYPYREKIKALICDLKDPLNGITESRQRVRAGVRSGYYHPDMSNLIEDHGLEELLYDKFKIHSASRSSLARFLKKIQFLVKYVIHIYTGMRHEECARTYYGCLGNELVSEPVLDDNGAILDSARMVSIVSTHTKFTGFKKEDTWLAPDSVVKAVKLAESIVEGIAHVWGVKPENCPLLINASILKHNKKPKFTATEFRNNLARGGDALLTSPDFRITKDDLVHLQYTDPDREFSQEDLFKEGEFWPLTSHQFRRSLAFYAANSGFVSMRTVSHQFKHLAKMMAKYYSRNNHNFLSIFGRWDDRKKIKINPMSHIAHDFQMAVPVAAVDQLFDDVFESEATLMGGTGSYLEKLKWRVQKGEVAVLSAKDTTIKMAEKGEIAYRNTLLGGCTKVGPCNDFLLGDMTACLSCPGAIIREDRLLSQLSKAEADMETFPEASVEHQIAKMEVTKLTDFRDKKLIKVLEKADA